MRTATALAALALALAASNDLHAGGPISADGTICTEETRC